MLKGVAEATSVCSAHILQIEWTGDSQNGLLQDCCTPQRVSLMWLMRGKTGASQFICVMGWSGRTVSMFHLQTQQLSRMLAERLSRSTLLKLQRLTSWPSGHCSFLELDPAWFGAAMIETLKTTDRKSVV